MLKIKKGIKKKIKGKKEKEEDLFDPENLAKYKKELEESKREAAAAAGSTSTAAPEESKPESGIHEEDEEWKRFKLLTAKIDVTLKNTSGDLDRIKTTSYFQKKAPNAVLVEKKEQWADLEKEEHFDFHQGESEAKSEFHKQDQERGQGPTSWGKQEQNTTAPEKIPEELNFEEPEKEIVELDDGLFDTSYLDAIESGEIQLAYIPDSPTEEVTGDDPFDTTAVAEVVKKIHEEEVKEKKKVNLGFAVDFLTKKSDIPPPVSAAPYTDKTPEIKKTKRGRPVHVDLLGFDGEEDTADSKPRKTQEKAEPIEKTPGEGGVDLKDLIREFEISDKPSPQTKSKVVSNFDLLVAEPEPEEAPEEKDEDDVWFRTDTEGEKVTKEKEDAYVDPFDTSVVEKLGFGRAELKILEDELLPASEEPHHPPPRPALPFAVKLPSPEPVLEKEEDFDFDPRKDEKPPSPLHLLDEVGPVLNFDATALTPQTKNLEQEEIDPFDTSNVSHIAIPGKSELRFLEDELVTPASLAQEFAPAFFDQSSVILHPLEAPDECISEVLELHQPKPTHQALPPEAKVFEDPFDTSDVVDAFAPGKAELKELESELLNSTEDFVPTRVCPLRNFKILHSSSITSTVAPPERQESLHPFDSVDENCEVEHRPLSPHVASAEDPFIDPFDTSAVTGINNPGKIEAKILEEELAAASFQPNLSHTKFERTPNTFSLPPAPLPVVFPITNFEEEEIDPFDTSIAESLVS